MTIVCALVSKTGGGNSISLTSSLVLFSNVLFDQNGLIGEGPENNRDVKDKE